MLPLLSARPSTTKVLLSVAVIAVAAFAVSFAARLLANPNVILLMPEDGAEWIRYPKPLSLNLGREGTFQTSFRKVFTADDVPDEAVLEVRALRATRILIDGKVLVEGRGDLDDWKQPVRVDLAPALTGKVQELRLDVVNHNGPRLVRARCPSIGLRTGGDWEVSEDGESWTQAAGADALLPSELSRRFRRPDEEILGKWYFFISLFALGFFLCLRLRAQSGRFEPRAHHLRWILLAAWLILGANNMLKLSPVVGLDIGGHINYINIIAREWRLPLADEGWQTEQGWQMFQAPLYYLVSALPYRILLEFFEVDMLIKLLRFIPILCGAAHIEICYRTVRKVYPNREDLQAVGTAVGGFVPMNVYMSQYIGNEPLAACLTAVAVSAGIHILHSGKRPGAFGPWIFLGAAAGLAILTKITALLLLPLVVVLAAFEVGRGKASPLEGAARAATALGVAAVLSGWFFVRNWLAFGKPFLDGWDPARGVSWWQDPGYRTLNQFWTFGEALHHPITASAMGFWDSMYSTFWLDGNLSSMVGLEYLPPWNYSFVVASAWFAVIPFSLLAAGAVRALRRPSWAAGQGSMFALICMALYCAAIMYMYLRLPAYSAGKATYALGLTPCFALLAATGFEGLAGRRVAAPAYAGGLLCWVFAGYASYFVLR